MKTTLRKSYLWVKLILISAVTLLSAQANARDSAIIWGVNGHPFTAYPGLTYETQLDALKDLGFSHYRVNISYTHTAKDLRALLNLAKQKKVTLLPLLTPSLDLTKETSEDLYKKAYDFAVELVSQFKNEIKVWELGNELENYAILQPCEIMDDGVQYNCAWGPASGVTAIEYHGGRWAKVSAVLKGLADGVVSVDPGILKAMGTAGWGHVGAFERMRRDGIKWDISVWHFYGDDPEWGLKKVAEFGKPIWVTEVNAPRGSESGAVKQAEGLTKIMRRFYDLEQRYKIEAVFVYELFDESYWLPSLEAVMGLIYLDKDGNSWKPGGSKPAACSVRTLLKGGFRLNYSPDRQVRLLATPEQRRAPFVRRDCDLCFLDNRDGTVKGKLSYAYCLVLGRHLDSAGLETWSAEMAKGAGFNEVVKRLIDSPEFVTRYETAQMSDAVYIKLLYRLLLDRDADGRGFSDYLKAITNGEKTRSDLVNDLLSSNEFTGIHMITNTQTPVTPVRFRN